MTGARARSRAFAGAMAAVAAAGALVAAPVAASEQGTGRCFSDVAGDTRNLQTGTATSEPRADIREHCINFGPTLSLSVQVAEPTNPEQDRNWTGGSFIGWFLDTNGDRSGDFFVDYSLDVDGRLAGRVADIRGTEERTTCTVAATFTGVHQVSGIERACIDDATSVAASPGVFYDTAPTQDAAGVVHTDTAPGGDAFDGPVAQQARTAARLAGADRFATAVAISRRAFPTAAGVVYLARADVFADAVAGGVLTRGPILLAPRCGAVPAIVRNEIARLRPQSVVALGGQAAICDATLRGAAGGRPAGRLAGSNRVETAVRISRHEFTPAEASEVYLARADVFADAVAGGVLTRGPVLLVPRCGSVPATVRQEVARVTPDRVLALGGPLAVCDSTLRGAAGGRPTGRLAGPDRIATAIRIARHAFPKGAAELYLARSDVFADAVAGGVLTRGPILLVPSCGTLPDSVATEISRVAPRTVFALGGPRAICDAMLQQAVRA